MYFPLFKLQVWGKRPNSQPQTIDSELSQPRSRGIGRTEDYRPVR